MADSEASNQKSGHLAFIQQPWRSLKQEISTIWQKLRSDNLSKRILKKSIAITLTVACSLINHPNSPFGVSAFVATMVAVFAHPARRVGQYMELVVLAILGGVLGIGWSMLGVYLSSLALASNVSAAYAIRAIFFTAGLIFHGYYRAHTPRMFTLVLVFIVMCLLSLMGSSLTVSLNLALSSLLPLALGVASTLFVNIFLFPEFSSTYLGNSTIDTLEFAIDTLTKAGVYFMEANIDSGDEEGAGLIDGEGPALSYTFSGSGKDSISQSSITRLKSELRSHLRQTSSIQTECQFEISISRLRPGYLRGISTNAMEKLAASVIAIINACETRFALLGDDRIIPNSVDIPTDGSGRLSRNHSFVDSLDAVDLDLIKPAREIEFGDIKLFCYILKHLKTPYSSFQVSLRKATQAVIACIAYAYDVPRPSKEKQSRTVLLEEVDKYCEAAQAAMSRYDSETVSALEAAIHLHEKKYSGPDFMPREEIFLISSFLMSSREAGAQIYEMLTHARKLVEARSRHKSRRIYFPRIHWRRWLYSGGEEDESTPAQQRQVARNENHLKRDQHSLNENVDLHEGQNRKPADPENQMGGRRSNEKQTERSLSPKTPKPAPHPIIQQNLSLSLRIRGFLADVTDSVQGSEDLSFAFKLTLAVLLVSFPAFVPEFTSFYALNRGSWAALQLIFVFEEAIGNVVQNFIVRSVGTTIGSLWGWAAYAAGNGNPYAMTFLLFIFFLPCCYITLATERPKAGLIAIISAVIVALSTAIPSVPGTALENFLRRWIAFIIGGAVAFGVSITILPAKSRSRMVEAIAMAVRKISDMENCIAYGADDAIDLKDGFPPKIFASFEEASAEAKEALETAEAFLPFCERELRLKGPFSHITYIYKEIIFVLYQMVDRMDNMLRLRSVYGSGPLEEFNSLIFEHRRNVVGSIILNLYAVHEALTTKFPLPQFLPSARLAHVRLINRVREVLLQNVEVEDGLQRSYIPTKTFRRKYLSWGASSAALAEVIEYLEELSSLTKLLIGSNEIRTGMLTRSAMFEYAKSMTQKGSTEHEVQEVNADPRYGSPPASPKREARSSRKERSSTSPSWDNELPVSLLRVQSRKQEAGLRKQRTFSEECQKADKLK